MQETEFKYYSGSSRSCLSPSPVKDVICVQEQEAMRHGINQLSLSERRQVEKTLKLPMYTVLIEPGCGKL
jgi:hypothetical protein